MRVLGSLTQIWILDRLWNWCKIYLERCLHLWAGAWVSWVLLLDKHSLIWLCLLLAWKANLVWSANILVLLLRLFWLLAEIVRQGGWLLWPLQSARVARSWLILDTAGCNELGSLGLSGLRFLDRRRRLVHFFSRVSHRLGRLLHGLLSLFDLLRYRSGHRHRRSRGHWPEAWSSQIRRASSRPDRLPGWSSCQAHPSRSHRPARSWRISRRRA